MKAPARDTKPAAVPKQKRRHRSRPTPKWLKAAAESPESVAQRRCLLVLSVLSGETPVTDAMESTGVSRQLYYQLEDKALRAMIRALTPEADMSDEVAQTLAAQLEAAQAKLKQLETEKRRAERLLVMTRKLVRPGSLTMAGRGRPRRATTTTKASAATSTGVGRGPSKSGETKAPTSNPDTSMATPTSAMQP